MTKEEAIALAKTNFWESLTPEEIAKFQMFEEKLCMPFSVFHKAMEEALGRPVWTHEFGLNKDGLRHELLGDTPSPTTEEIMDLIPEDKRIIVTLSEQPPEKG